VRSVGDPHRIALKWRRFAELIPKGSLPDLEELWETLDRYADFETERF
jgi:hypothetical protein